MRGVPRHQEKHIKIDMKKKICTKQKQRNMDKSKKPKNNLQKHL
jgi:hypothetical protein